MSHLRNALADYLTMRRALGYKMDKAERLLGQFTAFAEDPCSGTCSTSAARQAPTWRSARTTGPAGLPGAIRCLGEAWRRSGRKLFLDATTLQLKCHIWQV